jgi:hypothetical protein
MAYFTAMAKDFILKNSGEITENLTIEGSMDII